MKRSGFGADKLSFRTKVIGRRHFHKLKTSHDLYTQLAAVFMLKLSYSNNLHIKLSIFFLVA